MTREVVVTGVGAVTPLGIGARVLHDGWLAGRSGIEAGMAPAGDFEPAEHLSKREVRRADRFTQLAIVAADEALAEAGWRSGELPYAPERIGVVLGTGIGGIATLEDGKERLLQHGPKAVPPLYVPLMMGNAACGTLSLRYGLRGNSFGTVSACAAGAHATAQATRMIQVGEADAVVTGGSEAALTALSHAGFAALDALSESGMSRPFDARRDGFVMGEGAGILVLEDGARARERGAAVLGRIRGCGAASDAHHLTAPDRAGASAALAMARALEDAGAAPEDVDYVNAHGTSTKLNDAAETAAIKLALGDDARRTPVSSLKSAIGHLLGAAGAVEAVATVLALGARVLPPTLNYGEPDEGLDLDYVPNRPRPLRTRGRLPLALSNSFGFGGHNVVLALEGA
jgi:3-oxoacyl-[acyl-carrier-protein] synthase II